MAPHRTIVPPPPGGRSVAQRYLLRGERMVVVSRRHWVILTVPSLAAVTALVLLLWVAASTSGDSVTVFGVLTAVVLAWAGWRYLEWRKEWFIATDRRLLRTYGILTRRVAMMPLAKVTDMSYDRSILGRLLGYGQFVMESAGQDQSLSENTFVPDPDDKYQAMCETIFGHEVSDPDEDGAHWDDAHGSGEAGRHRWEAVEPDALPRDWEWVGEEARNARAATRRRVAIDPDPTPVH